MIELKFIVTPYFDGKPADVIGLLPREAAIWLAKHLIFNGAVAVVERVTLERVRFAVYATRESCLAAGPFAFHSIV